MNAARKKTIWHAWLVLVHIFALIGFGLVVGYFLIKFGLTDTTGIIDTQREAFLKPFTQTATVGSATGGEPSEAPGTPWPKTEEWQVMKAATARDYATVNRAAADSGVPARLIVENLIAEQLRLFFTDREDYKKFMYPLKILGPQTQFSWGVMGMKEATAIQVEQHLKDPTSPYYLGTGYEHALDFPATTTDITTARFTRMTDQHDHYWSYLYAGLYIKEVEAQWARAGFPIEGNPAVIATLYNIGFAHSTPNAQPQVGGAAIDILGTTYSFGGLAADFYQSDELTDLFPH